MENQDRNPTTNNQDNNVRQSSLEYKIGEFCYLLDNTRTAIVDLEYTVTSFIKEIRDRDNEQTTREKIIMDMKNLEKVVKSQEEKIGILENQILWLNYVEWGISKSAGIHENTMKEIHEAATYWIKIHQHKQRLNNIENENVNSEHDYKSRTPSPASSSSSSPTSSTAEDSNMG